MENSTFIFPTSQLIAANPLILPVFNPLVNHSLNTALSQKRLLDASYFTVSDDFKPVKKHFRSDLTANAVKASEHQPIIIEDSENIMVKPTSYAQKNNLQDLLQLSLFSAYVDQLEQVREVERRYSVLFANFSQSLFNQSNRETDLSTNDSDIDSICQISEQQSPNEERPRKLSTYIELDSDCEEDITVAPRSSVMKKNKSENSNGQITIDAELLADLPALTRRSNNKSARSRGLRLVWTPTDKKEEDIESLIKQLEDGLGVNISNQEKVCKLYSENGFSVEETLKKVLSQRSKYRFELKDKRAVVSLKNKSKKL